MKRRNFYQARAAQQLIEGSKIPLAKESRYYQELYTSDALQQERNTEHYGDELVTCSGKIFESLGLIQLTFPPDETLIEKIASVESILTSTEDISPTSR